MGINRIKYVNVDSGTQDSDFVEFENMGDVTASIKITKNGTYYAPNDIAGYKKVIVDVYEVNNQDITITENGEYTASAGYTGFGTVTVEVSDTPAVIEPLSVTPTTSQQIITAPANVDGYSPITVGAVDSAIDSNIVAGNIKNGINILGVTGDVVELNGTTATITPSTNSQTISPTSPYNAFMEVTVDAVDATIDSNIQPGNILSGVSILGVNGTCIELSGDTLSVVPSYANVTYTPLSPANGYTSVTVQRMPANIPLTLTNGVLTKGNTPINLTGIVEISGTRTLQMAQAQNTQLTTLFIDGDTLTDISGIHALREICFGCTSLTSTGLNNLTTISGDAALMNAFTGCSSLQYTGLTSVTSITGGVALNAAFNRCTSLISTGLVLLNSIGNRQSSGWELEDAFANCSKLTDAGMGSLRYIYSDGSGYSVFPNAFGNCTSLVTCDFAVLNVIEAPLGESNKPVFAGCTALHDVYFRAVDSSTFSSETNQLQYLFDENTGCYSVGGCTLHFPSNFDPSDPDHTFDVTTLAGYPTFGGSASFINIAYDASTE